MLEIQKRSKAHFHFSTIALTFKERQHSLTHSLTHPQDKREGSKITMTTDVASSSNSISNSTDPDTLLFGPDRAARLADHLNDQVLQRLLQTDIAATLPRIGDSTNPDLLLQQVSRPFSKHVDLVEHYAARNLFSVARIPPLRRQAIVNAVLNLNQKDEEEPNDTAKTPEPNQEQDQTKNSSFVYPSSKEDIPTPDQVNTLQAELEQLRTRLETAHAERNAHLVQVQSARSIQEQSQHVTNQISERSKALLKDDALQETVTAAVAGGRQLQDHLQPQGRAVVQTLDKLKRQRTGDKDDLDELFAASETTTGRRRRRVQPQSIEEQYEAERSAIATKSVQELSHLKNMLQQQQQQSKN